MEQQTDSTTATITSKFQHSARSIMDYWNEVDAKINADNAKFSGAPSSLNLGGMTLEQLITQRQQTMLGLAALENIPGSRDPLFVQSVMKQLQAIDAQIAKLRDEQQAKRETSLTQATMTSGTQTLTQTGISSVSATGMESGVGRIGHEVRPDSPFSTAESTIKKPTLPGTITIGAGIPEAGAMQGGPVSGGSQAAQMGGMTVHAPITVYLTVTSPISRIDAQNLVAEITPAIQEQIDRKQLLVRQS